MDNKAKRLLGGISVALLSVGLIVATPQEAYADACSDVNGLGCNVNYFNGQVDTGRGGTVITPPALDGVDNYAELTNVIGSHIGCAGGQVNGGRNGTGAAFIVLTMLDYPPGTPRNVACQVFNEWVATVQYWAPYTNYYVPDYYYGGQNTRYSYRDNDVQHYLDTRRDRAPSIVFFHPTNGTPLYAIKIDCANPVGRLSKLDRPRNYNLTPSVSSISPSESQSVEAGGKMAAQTRVNTTGEVNSNPTQWEITLITVTPGQRAPHEDEGDVTLSPTAPCQTGGGGPAGDYFQNAVASCKNVDKGTGVFNLGITPIDVNNIDTGDVPVGTRLCFVLSVQPRGNADGRWAHSKPRCTVVGKKPKIQIWGDDVAARGRIETSTSIKDARIFGSWVEYGAFSVGVNQSFASGSGLANQTMVDQSAWSKLTFANKNPSGNFGLYAPAEGFRTAPTIRSFFDTLQNKQAVPGASVDISTLTFGNTEPTVVRTANNLTITGGTLAAGRSVVVLASGKVTIDGDIKYTDETLSDYRAIPQVVIIADEIIIKDTVKQVDAWLVASGIINTCYNFTNNLTSGKCAEKLEVNGPVVAGRLLLNRTAGSGTGDQSGEPAERFNLRPDAHIWAQLRSEGGSKAQTVYSIEVPPRF